MQPFSLQIITSELRSGLASYYFRTEANKRYLDDQAANSIADAVTQCVESFKSLATLAAKAEVLNHAIGLANGFGCEVFVDNKRTTNIIQALLNHHKCCYKHRSITINAGV